MRLSQIPESILMLKQKNQHNTDTLAAYVIHRKHHKTETLLILSLQTNQKKKQWSQSYEIQFTPVKKYTRLFTETSKLFQNKFKYMFEHSAQHYQY